VAEITKAMQVVIHENPLEGLASRYAEAAARLAEAGLKRLESGEWVADTPILPGLWASGDSPAECLDEYKHAAVSWVKLKIAQQHRDIPVIADIDLNIF
jgi:predicted RNase H-like HicB family nuclease